MFCAGIGPLLGIMARTIPWKFGAAGRVCDAVAEGEGVVAGPLEAFTMP
jgi:hypothetical protein